VPAAHLQDGGYLAVGYPSEDGPVPRDRHAVRDRPGEGIWDRLAWDDLLNCFLLAERAYAKEIVAGFCENEKAFLAVGSGHQDH
jgi:hypothetical protein